MKPTKTYQVWWSQGDGSRPGPRFPRLEDALEYVAKRAGEASFAIRQPDESWFRNDRGHIVFSRWHERAA